MNQVEVSRLIDTVFWTKSSSKLVFWYLRVLRDLRGEQSGRPKNSAQTAYSSDETLALP